VADRLQIDLAGSALAGIAPPAAAIVLGSGLSGLAEHVEAELTVPYSEVPGYPDVGMVAGHAGVLTVGTLASVRVATFAGRVHQYQGASALDAAWPIRVAAALGCPVLIVTNACGGVSDFLAVGDIVLISDHINLTDTNPLIGWAGPPGGVPFVPMDNAYDSALRAVAYAAAAEEDIDLHEGVYASLLGPSYETPAEVAYLRTTGADVVGMSTVPEVIAARALGLRVLGFSLVTNVAADPGLSHAEVLEVGRRAAERLTRLTLAILRRL
jgi:purine-nucleoside phosphorylase